MSNSSQDESRGRNLSRGVQIAEITASLGVVITLIVLIAQVRENTAIVRISSFQQSMDGVAQWRALVASDPTLTSLLDSLLREDIEHLDAAGRVRLTLVMNNLFSAYENAYFSRETGLLADAQWERFEGAACAHMHRARRIGLWDSPPQVTAEFADHLRSVCRSP